MSATDIASATPHSTPYGTTSEQVELCDAQREMCHNVIVFGESGTGKSSIINMTAGKQLAPVSNQASGCTFESKPYVVSLDNGGGQTYPYRLWDTCGLNEGDHGTYSAEAAIESLRLLIQNLQKFGGTSLLVYCIRGTRFHDIWVVNHNLFADIVCQGKVPVVLAITGLENEDPTMESWWERNSDAFKSHNLDYESHACLTTTLGKKNNQDGNFMYQDEYDESTHKLKELITKGCAKIEKPWRIESERDWMNEVIPRMTRYQEDHRKRTGNGMRIKEHSTATTVKARLVPITSKGIWNVVAQMGSVLKGVFNSIKEL